MRRDALIIKNLSGAHAGKISTQCSAYNAYFIVIYFSGMSIFVIPMYPLPNT